MVKCYSVDAEVAADEAVKRRDDAIAAMTPQLKAVYEKEREAFENNSKRNLLFWYDRGRTSLDVQRNAVPDGRKNAGYGEGAIDQLVNALMIDRSLIYKAMILADMYPTKKDLEAKVKEAHDNGADLLWTHYVILCHAPDLKEGEDTHSIRRELVQLVIDNKLNTRALKDEYNARYKSGGEEKTMTVSGALRRMDKLADKSVEEIKRLTEALRDGIDAAGTVSPATIDKLRTERVAMNHLSTTAAQAVKDLTALEVKLTKAANRKAQTKKAETNEETEEAPEVETEAVLIS